MQNTNTHSWNHFLTQILMHKRNKTINTPQWRFSEELHGTGNNLSSTFLQSFSRRAEFEWQLIRAPLRHLSLPRHFTSLSLPTLVVVSYRRVSTRGVPYLTTDVTQKDMSEIKPLKAISFALGLVPCDFCIHPPVLLFIHLSDVTFWVAFDKWDLEGEKIWISIKKYRSGKADMLVNYLWLLWGIVFILMVK